MSDEGTAERFGHQTQADRDRAVALFAEGLRRKIGLPKNVVKGLWLNASRLYLVRRLYDELVELDRAINATTIDRWDDAWLDAVLSEAYDVAAFAAFLDDQRQQGREGNLVYRIVD